MSHEVLNLQQAAQHVFVDANDLKHVAQRGEIAAQKRGDDWFFEHRALDEWAQRNLLAAKPKALNEVHRSMADGDRRDARPLRDPGRNAWNDAGRLHRSGRRERRGAEIFRTAP